MSTLTQHSEWDLPAGLFIETGSGNGDTLMHASGYYDCCWSIEKNWDRYVHCVCRLRSYQTVHVFYGDSPVLLRKLLHNAACLPKTTFWLDAHDEQSPILKELGIILLAEWTLKPTILIDDIQDFGSIRYPDYPPLSSIETMLTGWRRTVRSEGIHQYDFNGQ